MHSAFATFATALHHHHLLLSTLLALLQQVTGGARVEGAVFVSPRYPNYNPVTQLRVSREARSGGDSASNEGRGLRWLVGAAVARVPGQWLEQGLP